MNGEWPVSDGLVRLRASVPEDVPALIVGRDAVFHRWLGAGSAAPAPTACIVVAGDLAGWIDYETGQDWLQDGEVNVGYNVFPGHRGRGYAGRALQMLMHHLALRTQVHTATLLIHPQNERSLAVAARARFVDHGEINGSRYFKRDVLPPSYSDGQLTIRAQHPDDLDMDLAAKDAEQVRWLWLPEHRVHWGSLTIAARRAHALRGLRANHAAFGLGPKWTFAGDYLDIRAAAYVDCDLANDKVPAGEANISYSVHPGYRGKGLAQRAVRLVLQFLRDHTAARAAHIIVDTQNLPSLRVARAFAPPSQIWRDRDDSMLVRHVIAVR